MKLFQTLTKVNLQLLTMVFAILVLAHLTSNAAEQPKPATTETKNANSALLKELPFSNKQDFEDAKKGFIAPLSQDMVKGKQGNPVWNPKQFDFIEEGKPALDTVNPSLWRQSQLVNISGLFEVTDGIYQIRNQDLSNMTIVEGDKGIVIFDPLLSTETAKAALDLYYQNRGKKPVVAVIYTHSHADHYSGVRGVVDEADVKSGKVKILAPVGFLEHAISENVMAGNAMGRRVSYMYGNLLPPSPTGQVGAGLGMTTAAGTVTLIPPTDIIKKTGEKRVIDGLTYEFLWAPGTEAPTEMLVFLREKNALNAAEDAAHTLHNTYSLRGTKIRDPLAWSKFLNQALDMWGSDSQVLFGMHHWPVFGNENVINHLKMQRDMYRYINDETLRLANQGYNMVEIAEMFELPKNLANYWSNRGYYGSYNHNVKSTYVLYLGWFDGNPATLHPWPRVEAGKRYVKFMGGADAVLANAKKSYENGDYRWVAEVVNHVIMADPNNQAARNLQADALEQMGYQAESGPWRNFYLAGAKELREGVKELPTPNVASPDSIRAMTPDLFFDYLAMRLNGPKAADKTIILNFDFSDLKEKYMIEMVNGVLNHTPNRQSENADATITLTKETLNNIVLKQTILKDAISSGDVKIDGNEAKLDEMLSYLDTFDFWWNIVTPVQSKSN